MVVVRAARVKNPDASILEKRKLGRCNPGDENGAEIDSDDGDDQ
jgi:hypothetical protein